MKQDDIDFVVNCIKSNAMYIFYTWSKWLKLRLDVLEEDKNECQKCKSRGRYKKAVVVHHVNHVKNNPELALEKFYVDIFGNVKRQLVSLCKACHEEEHPERFKKNKKEKPLTEERW